MEEAENIQLEVEEAQRNRRRQREDDQVCIFYGLKDLKYQLILAKALHTTLV